MKKSEMGSVLEFRFPEYLIYGVCIAEDPEFGDTLAMYSRKFSSPISKIGDLVQEPIRYKILFFVRTARARKNADILRVVGQMDSTKLPGLDRRFRSNMTGIATQRCWHIVEDGVRTVVPFLTKETALLSSYGIPNMEFIRNTYDRDLYPWSAELLNRGPLNFDPVEFEAEMRAKLAVS